VPRLSLPPYQWWNEALHGVAVSPGVVFAPPTPVATSFPQVIGTASSWNASLWAALGGAIAREARAFSNAGHAGLTFWTPNLNVFRDPRWGRGQETPGEDPGLNGDYVVALVRGLQGSAAGASPTAPLAVSACCKHFDAFSLENWGGVTRYSFNAVVSEQDLADTYLPAFRECVVTAAASCIMCSYNALNGVPMCANKPFLTDLARTAWGFAGYVTADCDAVQEIWAGHNYTRTLEEAIGDALDAGVDIGCGDAMAAPNVVAARDAGHVTPPQIDAALGRLFTTQFRLGMFDPPAAQPLRALRPDAIATRAHAALALDAARQGLVLLKNDGAALPLRKRRAAPAVALIGPHANASDAMQGNYFGAAPFLITPLTGAQAYAPGAAYAPGCLDVLCANSSGFAAATALAAGADVVLLMVGLDLSVEAEGLDRYNLTLPGMQPALVDAVLAAAQPGAVVIMVLLSGGCVDVSPWVSDARLRAILWAGYPGQSGGRAIADTIWGRHAPAGRLTTTWYEQSFTDQVSMFDFGMRPNASSGNPGRGYRFYTGAPVFEFGAGLSYSSWSVAWAGQGSPAANLRLADVSRQLPLLRIDSASGAQPASLPPLANVALRVNNEGPRASAKVLLAFLCPPAGAAASALGAPQRQLVWYGRTGILGVGGVQEQSFVLTARHFSFAGLDGLPATLPGEWTLEVEGLAATLTLQQPGG